MAHYQTYYYCYPASKKIISSWFEGIVQSKNMQQYFISCLTNPFLLGNADPNDDSVQHIRQSQFTTSSMDPSFLVGDLTSEFNNKPLKSSSLQITSSPKCSVLNGIKANNYLKSWSSLNMTTPQNINNNELEVQVTIPNIPPISNKWEAF